MPVENGSAALLGEAGVRQPILICLLGPFRLLKDSQPVAVRSGGKTEALLYQLGLRPDQAVRRDALLDALWPEVEPALAGQSLNSLVYSIHHLLGDAIDDAPPIVHQAGCYRLNTDAGVGVDLVSFHTLARDGERLAAAGYLAAAADAYRRAIELYRGDLFGDDVRALVERERLRATYLNLLSRLADFAFDAGEYAASLEYTTQLLLHDPCREDAYRLAMRCYVRRGERSQAFRQYRLCETILRVEFDATPEAATRQLFEQVRLDPSGI